MKTLNLTNLILPGRSLIVTLVVIGLSAGFSEATLLDRGDGESATRAATLRQDPNPAQRYRKLAEAKRKEAQRVPKKRECHLAWARYYDCLADREEAGDNRPCPAQPPDCG